jgi:hypothetical protein
MNKDPLTEYVFMWNGRVRIFLFKDKEHAKQYADFLSDTLGVSVSYFKDKT